MKIQASLLLLLGLTLITGCFKAPPATGVEYPMKEYLLIRFDPEVLYIERICLDCTPLENTRIDSCEEMLREFWVPIDSTIFRSDTLIYQLQSVGALYLKIRGLPNSCKYPKQLRSTDKLLQPVYELALSRGSADSAMKRLEAYQSRYITGLTVQLHF